MLWTLVVILLALWLLGLVTAYTFGDLVHLRVGCSGDPPVSRTQGRLTRMAF